MILHLHFVTFLFIQKMYSSQFSYLGGKQLLSKYLLWSEFKIRWRFFSCEPLDFVNWYESQLMHGNHHLQRNLKPWMIKEVVTFDGLRFGRHSSWYILSFLNFLTLFQRGFNFNHWSYCLNLRQIFRCYWKSWRRSLVNLDLDERVELCRLPFRAYSHNLFSASTINWHLSR